MNIDFDVLKPTERMGVMMFHLLNRKIEDKVHCALVLASHSRFTQYGTFTPKVRAIISRWITLSLIDTLEDDVLHKEWWTLNQLMFDIEKACRGRRVSVSREDVRYCKVTVAAILSNDENYSFDIDE